jgi:hypothetical protein
MKLGELGVRGWVLMHMYGEGRGCHLPASLGPPLAKFTLKRDRIVLINDVMYPLKPLQLLV